MLNLIDQWSIEVKLLFKFTSITCIAPKVSDILNVWNKDKVQCEWSKSHVMYFSNIKKTFKTNRSIKDFQKNHQNLYKIIIPTFFFFKLQITPPPLIFTNFQHVQRTLKRTLNQRWNTNINLTLKLRGILVNEDISLIQDMEPCSKELEKNVVA